MNAVDTNVLLYVHDPRDLRKQSIATNLVASLANTVLIWQVACEYIAASRKLAPLGFRQEDAVNKLYSEDLVGVGKIPGIDIVNPFVP